MAKTNQNIEKKFFNNFKSRLETNQAKFLLVLFSVLLSLIITGFSFFIRVTYFSDLGLLETNIIRAIRMILVYIILPYLFIRKFLVTSSFLESTGLTLQEIKKGMFFGVILYTIALVIIIAQFSDPNFKNDWIDSIKSESSSTLIFYAILASIMAAITDLWTRGYVLFQLCEYSSVQVGFLFHVFIWMLIHWYEVIILTASLGFFLSFFLTLILGVGGGIIALKTRNIVGLILGHIWLNLGFLIAVMTFL